MKKLALSSLLLLISTASIYIPGLKVSAQKGTELPAKLNSDSSLAEILDWLNQNAFPYARVGVRESAGSGPRRHFGLPTESVSGGERIFSEGFHLKFVNGCHVTLSNEDVTIIDARNRSSGSFYKFITQKNGERQLTPQVAMVFLPLNRMSEKRGKGPHLLNNDHQYAKSVGTWRTSYEQRGFFKKSIFDVELTPAEQSQTKELGHFEYLTFTFETRDLAEQFNAAFRRAIKICNSN
ncbi:MAG TPA: hypothetical protein VEV42_12110 [Pyrinomonadaceae bacterium]|nr:hypothetical protein [Pyrinomonadaceae bacterium]